MKYFITYFCLLTILQLSGCSIARYPTAAISKNPETVHLEFKSIVDLKKVFSDVKIQNDPNNKNIIIITCSGLNIFDKIKFDANNTSSIKYHRNLLYREPHVNIKLKLSNGHKHPVFFDTGFDGTILLSSDLALKNKLAIYPSGPMLPISSSGICIIPELKIGSAQIKDIIAGYEEQQWQLRILNIPVYKHPDMILGRELIRQFDYVIFNNKNKELTLSKDGQFKPDNPQSWSSFPFYEDPNAGNTIMVKIPVAGHILEVAFDSCGWKPGLEINQKQWQTIKKDLLVKNIANSHYMLYMDGKNIPCKKATISELRIGDKKIKNAKMIIYNEADNQNSILSLGYFQDTTVVLDYVNKLFWIKKAK